MQILIRLAADEPKAAILYRIKGFEQKIIPFNNSNITPNSLPITKVITSF